MGQCSLEGLYNERLLQSKDLPLQIQISVDDPDPSIHDAQRGEGSFRRAIQGIPWMVEQGLSVRISSTRSFSTASERQAHDDAMQQWMMRFGLVESRSRCADDGSARRGSEI